MKIPVFLKALLYLILIIILIDVAGWAISETGILGNNAPVNLSFVYQVQVVDANGTPVPGQQVYFLSCLQKPSGWLTPTSYVNNDTRYVFTDKTGFVEIDSINYSLSKGDIVWLGASTNETLLQSDHENKAFNSGSIGEWTHRDYLNVSRTGDLPTKWASLILIRNSDGRMIDVDQYSDEHGLNNLSNNPPIQFIDYLKYIDDQKPYKK